MESLKQFRVTFWCEGRKGIFSKKPYKFTVSFRDDIMLSTFLINARTEKEAVKTGKNYVENIVQCWVEHQATGEYMILTGNMADTKRFEWSPKIYAITVYEIKFISCEMVCDWAKERVERAARELTMEQFKQVFSEIPAEIFH